VAGPVVLEVHDSAGKLVRSYSSADQVEQDNSKLSIPTYWLRPPQRLSADAGMHRFLWDMHYTPVAGIPPQYPIAAVPHNTAPAPTSPWVMPGAYTVVLKVAGRSFEQPMTVTMDPRIKAAHADLEKQFALSMTLYDDLSAVQQAIDHAESLRSQIEELQHKHVKPKVADNLEALDKKLEAVEGGAAGGRPSQPADSLRAMRNGLQQLMNVLQEADVAPTVQAKQAAATLHETADTMLKRWKEIETSDLPATNKKLRQEHLPELKPELRPPAPTANSDDLDDGL
jgi:hypothetical protein